MVKDSNTITKFGKTCHKIDKHMEGEHQKF